MLVRLSVRDLVLIDELTLELAPGFNVLTGETGAGKSLVATAVHLLLGRKADTGIVRHGAAEAEVEGLFDVSDEPRVAAKLEEAGLPGGDELLIRRIVPAEGRQRCFVNGRIASLALLGELADGLASFASQHEHLALLDPARQLALLDDYADLGKPLEAMAARHADARKAADRYEGLLAKERDRARELDYLSFQLREIDELSPGPDEIEKLEAEIERLRHQELLLGASRGASDALYEADGSVYERLSTAARELGKAAEHDPALSEDAREVADLADRAEEVARNLAGYADSADADPARLDELIERRDALVGLVKKHGREIPDLLLHVEELRGQVDELSRYEEAVEEARAGLTAAKAAAGKTATKLTDGRKKASRRLAKAVAAELEDLSLGGGAFEVAVERDAEEPGPRGWDRAEIRVSLNPGEGTHALRKVASGGELSRLMLAIRRAAAGVGPVSTYVFDEVDAGIGGAIAQAVGRKLREVAGHHQVICVTHLPQIAGLADDHLVVAKESKGGRTKTEVRRLGRSERVQEVARMLGGEKLTDKTKAAARELMAAD